MRQHRQGPPRFAPGAGPKPARSPARAAEQQLRRAVEHLRRREPAAAEQVCRQIVKRAPQVAQTHFLLGAALDQQGKADAAMACYRQAVALNARYAPAWINLADALRQSGKGAAAVEAARTVIALSPESWQGHYTLGRALLELGAPKEAIAPLAQALEHGAPAVEVRSTLAKAHQRAGETEIAIAAYRGILDERPNEVSALLGLAGCLRELGELGQSRLLVEKAYGLAPDNLEVARSMAAHAETLDSARLAALIGRAERALGMPTVPAEDRICGHFACARLQDRAGKYPAAFAHYSTGNALRQPQRTFDPAPLERALRGAAATFTASFYQARRGFGLDTRAPVFIFGMPRSGTTLVEQILAGHPQVFGAGEIRCLAEVALPGAPEPIGLATVAARAPSLSRDEAAALAQAALAAFPAEASGFGRMTDKTPANFLLLGLLALLFPQASFLHCERHPLDTCLSCFEQDFREGNAWSFSLEGLAAYYRLYRQFMAHWQSVLPVRIVDVRYEDVIADLPRSGRKLVAAVGLEWHDDCLRFHEVRRRVATASMVQVRKPLYASSVGKWRKYAVELAPLRSSIGDLIEQYEKSAPAGCRS